MATETRPVPVSDITGEQLALSTTLAALGVPPKRDTVPCKGVMLRSTADFRLHVNPALKAFLKTTDDGATYTDYTTNVTDRNTATVATLSSLDTLANGDWLLLGADRQFGGAHFDLDAKNGNASVLTGQYWDGSAWQDLVLVDGTISPAGTALGQDGNITWTLPTDWAPGTFNGTIGYWVRLKVSAALDASVTLAEAALLNKDSSRGYCYGHVLYLVPLGAEDGAIEAIVASGTPTLDVTWCFGNTLPAIATDGTVAVASIAAGDNNIGNVDIVTLPAGNLGQQAMAASVSVVPASNVADATYLGDIKFGEALPAGTASIGGVRDDGPQVAGTRTLTTSADMTTTANISGAPTSTQKLVLREITISVDTAMSVIVEEETSGTDYLKFFLPANGTVVYVPRYPPKLATADKKWNAVASVAGNIAISAVTTSEA